MPTADSTVACRTPDAEKLQTWPANFAHWPPELLQRVVEKYDGDDWFLLRQVCRGLRDEADCKIVRLAPVRAPANFAQRFKSVVSLDLARFVEGDGVCIEEFCSSLPCLRELNGLHLPDRRIEDSKEWIECLGKLTRLELAVGDGIPTEGARITRHCRALERLHINNNNLPWSVIIEMVDNVASTLSELDIDHADPIAPQPAPDLQELNTGRLKTLRLRHKARVHRDVLDPQQSFSGYYMQLSAFNSLRSLDLSGSGCSSDGIWFLAELAGLTSLNLSNTNVNNVGLQHLWQLTGLRELNLGNTDVSEDGHWLRPRSLPRGWSLDAMFRNLTSIDLSGCRFTGYPSWGLTMHKMTSLQKLSIRGTNKLFSGLPAGLRELRDLEATLYPVNTISKSGRAPHVISETRQLQHLAEGAQHLTRLVLSTPLTDKHPCYTGVRLNAAAEYAPPGPVVLSSDWVEQLATLTALQELKLEGSFVIMGWDLQPLAHLKALRRLDFSETKLQSPVCLVPLERMGLEWLRLPDNFCPPEQLPAGLRIACQRGSFSSLSITGGA